MEDIPQPADEPYSEGDEVAVYLDERDPDAQHRGETGVVTEVLEDSLDEETGRGLDAYSYRIEVEGDELDVWFRHMDLVPADNRYQ